MLFLATSSEKSELLVQLGLWFWWEACINSATDHARWCFPCYCHPKSPQPPQDTSALACRLLMQKWNCILGLGCFHQGSQCSKAVAEIPVLSRVCRKWKGTKFTSWSGSGSQMFSKTSLRKHLFKSKVWRCFLHESLAYSNVTRISIAIFGER